MNARQVASEISYASSVETRAGKAFVRLLENSTGRLGLIRRADGYEHDVAQGADFWDVIAARYGLGLNVVSGTLDAIPRTGPVVVVANHPFGILDGLIMGQILSRRRQGDFRVLAHQVFVKAPDLQDIILPISFAPGKEAQRLNLSTRRSALDYLRAGGAVGVFPGGTVSTSARPFGPALDPRWRTFTAKMIARSGAQVVPVYFEGANSRLFQLASRVHSSLRLGLLIREFGRRVDRPVPIRVGAPIDPDRLSRHRSDPKAVMDLLRRATYALGQGAAGVDQLGYDFEG